MTTKKNKMKAVILAGGRGTRMKATLPKVLYPVCGRPMIGYILDAVRSVGIKDIIVVTGYKSELLKDFLKGTKSVRTVKQKKFLGSADALKRAKTLLRGYKGDVLVLYGDDPLIKQETLEKLIDKHEEKNSFLTLLSVILDDPTGYGRIVRDENKKIVKIVEEINLSEVEKTIDEINVGAYCFKSKTLFSLLGEIKNNNPKKEYLLTDIVQLINEAGLGIDSTITDDTDEILGVNSRIELARAEKILTKRICHSFMKKGVTVLDPDTTFVNVGAVIGKETVIHPHTVIEDDVKIGEYCSIGPFARIRKGSRVNDYVEVGNFVELVRTKVDKHSKIKHFSYLGDTVIGKNVNVGAGTITANYDGKNKNITQIEDNAFIGTGTILVAPVKVGKKAVTGAGCVVTKKKNVPAGAVVVGVPAHTLKKRVSGPKGRRSKRRTKK